MFISASLIIFIISIHFISNSQSNPIEIVSRLEDNQGNPIKVVHRIEDNGYYFQFDTGYGSRTEKGEFEPIGENQVNSNVTGYYSVHFPSGPPLTVTFVADENGYRPKFRIGEQVVFVPTAAIASVAGGGLG